MLGIEGKPVCSIKEQEIKHCWGKGAACHELSLLSKERRGGERGSNCGDDGEKNGSSCLSAAGAAAGFSEKWNNYTPAINLASPLSSLSGY